MFRAERKAREKYLRQESAKWPTRLVDVPQEAWPAWPFKSAPPIAVKRSRGFLAQLFQEPNGVIRMSVCRAALDQSSRWQDGVSWDELQDLKREAGYGDAFAVEIYPKDGDVVNVANMRHLWILPAPLAIGWHEGAA